MYTLERSSTVPRRLEETFQFFENPRNLGRITPPWLKFRVQDQGPLEMRKGLRIEYRVAPLLVPQKWVSEITEYDPPFRFVDEQRVGPYRRWHHQHDFRAIDGGTEIRDTVSYALPFGPLGRLAHAALVRRQLEAIFRYREKVITDILG